jgi:hypothetical protein
MSQSLILAMAAHVAHAALLYALLTIARAPTIWGIGRDSNGSNPFSGIEPRISANLSNQFEWPVLFYAACIILLLLGKPDRAAVGLAWVFVGGRLLHSAVQIGTRNVQLRGIVFTLNFLAVLGLWILVVTRAASSPVA